MFTETIDTYVPTSTDLDAWTELDPATGNTMVNTSVGLFGADLTDFLDNCALATEECDVAEYDNFSGWAIGVQWTAEDAPPVPICPGPNPCTLRQVGGGVKSSVIFEDQSLYVAVYWHDELNDVISGTFDVDISETTPVDTDITFD